MDMFHDFFKKKIENRFMFHKLLRENKILKFFY